MNTLKRLQDFGQSVWYDNIERKLLRSGELSRMIKIDGLRGITSNPTIFEKAIGGSGDYDASLARLIQDQNHTEPREVFFGLAIEDIQAAADLLKPVYMATKGRDDLVSLEVSPVLALETVASVIEAWRLGFRGSRPKSMIKVAASRVGVVACENLVSVCLC